MNFYAIDLFAGCGGLSEGFYHAGFDVIAQVEMDRWSCETLVSRHLYHGLKRKKRQYSYNRYLKEELSREYIFDKYPDLKESISHRVIKATLAEDNIETICEKIETSRNYHGASKFHVLLGGPPCQPYSPAGRSRDPSRMENDERHFLYKHYLDILSFLQPDIFVYENVPGLFTAKAEGTRIFHNILEDFESLEPPYEITPPLIHIAENPSGYILNSANFKIPQNRRRLILIGYKKSLESLNPGIKNVFSRIQKQALRNSKNHPLTVNDAIGDLPSVKPGEGSDGWLAPYNSDIKPGDYQRKVRRGSPGILNHRARTHMESDIERYRFFIESCMDGGRGSTLRELMEERPDLLPEHRTLDKFQDRFKVQWWTRPALTITAHIWRDGHYYIHPDVNQCRSFTVREAARCQSFPDNFKFEGPRSQQFKQVGNAVPPLLARAIAGEILRELRKIYN